MSFSSRVLKLGSTPVRCCLAFVCVLCFHPLASAERAIDFGRDILPILSENCFHCHGPDQGARQADLRLDIKEMAFRTSGDMPIISPGKSAHSELFRRITSQDADELMPPQESNRKLQASEIDLLRRWIDSGATWGKHWAYEPPPSPTIPKVSNISWPRGAIDFFVLEKLEAAGLTPSDEAPRETLIRRVTLDVTGLPPTLQEVKHFLDDSSSQAYEKLVDRLLSSPRYGERMAWDWLDAARYADTNGFQGDPERTMWPWRDWVVSAFNANMPYDQFTVEQLAGDLLPGASQEQKLASGFNRNNMHNGEGGRISEETRVENIFDRVETTATIWLGATFTCCRCHDHKYDPFTLRDYYGLYDIYNQMSETGAGRGGQAPPIIELTTAAESDRLKQAVERVATAATAVEAFELKKFPRAEGVPLTESDAIKLPGNLPAYIARTEPKKRNVDQLLEAIGYFEADGRDPEYVQQLKKSLSAVRQRDAAQNGITKVMIMDQLEQPRDTFILSKGAYDKPTTTRVVAAFPASLTTVAESIAHVTDSIKPRLTRLDLARWLVSPQNPLTARVTVNRFWQSLFGIGLIKTVEDFGVQGEKPSHPELLDWLATEFVASGWDVKSLHKQIVMSATYRQSSKVAAGLIERDPENRLLARSPRFRSPAWMLRDVALQSSGLLVGQLGGPSVKPYQPGGIWEEATFGKKTYEQEHGQALYRRSLYVYWRRIVGPTMFFDSAARQTCTVKQVRTNTPLHALSTLNDITYVEAARVMAERLLASEPDIEKRIETAFRLVTCRAPKDAELGILRQRFEILHKQFADDPESASRLLSVGESQRKESLDPLELAALTGVCQLILNLDESISKE